MNYNKLIFLFYLVLAIFMTSCQSIQISKNGKSDYRIVLPYQADSLEIKSAQILQSYLSKITSCKINISTEDEYPEGKGIFIGHTEKTMRNLMNIADLDEDGIAIKTINQDVYIYGKDRACLFASYTFLEEIGCRKLSDKVEFIPKKKTLRIPEMDVFYAPKIKFREVLYTHVYDSEFSDWHKLDAHKNNWGSWCHTFNQLVPPDKFAETHPEYYALVNGKRQFGSQLCLSNPEVLDIVVDKLVKQMEEHPEFSHWSVSQNDNTNYCQCEACKKMDSIEGGPTASVLHFVNQVAKHFPEKTISTLAYQYSRSVPKSILPEKNVNIMLCNIESLRHQPFYETDPAFASDLKDWGERTNNIIVWDYIIQFKNLISPFPNLHTIKPNIEFLTANHVEALFEQGNREIGGEMAELRAYLTAKMMWDPSLDTWEVIKDFTSHYYGKANKYINKYIQHLHKELEKSDQKLAIFGNPVQAKNSYLSPENIRQYMVWFDRAEKSVQQDPELLERVKYARLPLMYARLEIARSESNTPASLVHIDSSGNININREFIELAGKFRDLCNKQGVSRVKEWSTTPDEYYEAYVRMLARSATENRALRSNVRALTQASKKYAQGDLSILTDGLFGSNDFSVNWLGYEGNHLEMIIDLGEMQDIHYIGIDFLQALNDWIFLPEYVSFSFSKDGLAYSQGVKINNPLPQDQKGILIQSFENQLNQAINSQYIKIHAHSMLRCPKWHPGAGGPVWIFADEIIVQ